MSTDIEFSPQRLTELARISAGGDEEALAKAVTDIPSLVLEVTRLRQELAEKAGKIASQLRKITELQGLIDAMRPGQEAQLRLDELRNQIAEVVAKADRAKREQEDTQRKLESAEQRIKSLISSMTELARASGGEALVNEKARGDKLEDELLVVKRENFDLRERIARLERTAG